MEKSILTPVKHWNAEKRAKGQYILIYTLGNGSMVDTPRQRGYVVQKYSNQGGERSRFHLYYKNALADYESPNFN